MSLELEVAGMGIRVDADDVDLELGPEHARFRVGGLAAPDLWLTFSDGGEAPWFPRGARRFRGHNALDVYEGEGGWVAATSSGARLRAEAWFSEDCARGRVRMSPWPAGRTLASTGPLYEVACISRLARLGGRFLVHACALDLPGVGGVLLPGSSGRGKSTLAALAGEATLGDERIALTRGPDGQLWIHGTPWRGTEDPISSASVPLRAILLLGPHEPTSSAPLTVSPIKRAEAFRRLAFHAFPPLWDRVGTGHVLDLALQAAAETPTGELRFRPDHEALRAAPSGLLEPLARAVEALRC